MAVEEGKGNAALLEAILNRGGSAEEKVMEARMLFATQPKLLELG